MNESDRNDDDELPIRVFVERNRKVFLIWNVEDVKRLRTKHRIVGELVGTLVGHKSQNEYLGLPLQLSTEEVSLGCFYGFLELVAWKDIRDSGVVFPRIVSESCRKKKRSYSEMELSGSHLEDTENLGTSQKIRRVVGHFCKNAITKPFHFLISLWDWRRSWYINTARPESLKQTYLEPVVVQRDNIDSAERATKPIDWNTKEAIMVEDPNEKASVVVLFRKGMSYPDFLPSFGFHSFESRRLTVFHDLWRRGFYISSGVKFGADFLAYADDPILFHASLAVVVAEEDSEISPRDLVAFGRLGVSTKKKATLAYVTSIKNEEDFPQVSYLCIRWVETLP
ncbi:hypothetical protein GpartN1_g3665.t1 [Galdieria partita]|uniref:tRNA-splicing endonuclease subunit Sen34 n=1 Tax=Galdieria partita TaxID=83374 RepID=A0A9C7UQE2_9RHOD|nr:hypothetical protein GpartN1_g3665.t1 [Galdieria partita]